MEKTKIKIKISEIIALKQRLDFINSIDVNNIEFIDENNNTVNISGKIIDDFMYTGLNNLHFITTGFYKTGFDGFDGFDDSL